MHYSAAIVRFSELNIAEACWPILFTFYVFRQKRSGQLNTIWGQLSKRQNYVRADQITQLGSAITVHLDGHIFVIRLYGCPVFLF